MHFYHMDLPQRNLQQTMLEEEIPFKYILITAFNLFQTKKRITEKI